MKKVFCMLMMVMAFTMTAQAQNRFTVKAGLGASNVSDIDETDNGLHWKLGVGYELRLSKLIGIEPSVLISNKAFQTKVGDEDISYGYLSVPVMCNFHLGRVVLAAGPYFDFNVGKDDLGPEPKSMDGGIQIGGKYVFDCGLNLGLECQAACTDAFKIAGGEWVTAAAVIGWSF